VTETDLITADGSNENVELPQTVTSNISTPAEADDASNGASTAETAPTADVASGDRRASLSTMVLPELRALAKEVGVEGASGMRKSELVAAIRERRGESNGRPHAATGSDANDTATPDTATPDTATPDTATPATDAGTTEQAAEEQTPPRRERRGASRGASAPGGSDENTPEPDQQKPNKQKIVPDTDIPAPTTSVRASIWLFRGRGSGTVSGCGAGGSPGRGGSLDFQNGSVGFNSRLSVAPSMVPPPFVAAIASAGLPIGRINAPLSTARCPKLSQRYPHPS